MSDCAAWSVGETKQKCPPKRARSTSTLWLRDESLEQAANLPDPDVLTVEIVDDLEAALEQFRAIAGNLG